jgi:dipeptidyl aminopeptidase/acylaminoacyl peptidase
MKLFNPIHRAGAALLLMALVGAPVLAQVRTRPLIPVEDFTRQPKLSNIQFSPDGKKFAALVDVEGRRNIAVASVDTGDIRVITSYSANDVAAYRWISDVRLVFSLTDLQAGLAEQDGGGMFAVDADGKNGRQLSLTLKNCIDGLRNCRSTSFHSRVRGSDDEIIAVSNERSFDSPDLIRLDTRTGKRTLLTEQNPGRVRHWVLDKNKVPRAAWSSNGRTLENTFWYRDSDAAPWRRILSWNEFTPGIVPLGFAPDGRLFVASETESNDKAWIYEFDFAAGKLGQRLARHPQVDLGLVEDPSDPEEVGSPLVFDPKTSELIGIDINGDRPETVWLDERKARIQATVDASLPKGNINELRPLNDSQVVVLSRSGSEPGVYYLYDGAKRELREIARPRPWIKAAEMGRVEVVRYKARDDLEIPGYLTLPAADLGRKPPLVVWVHGGPWARDHLRFDPEVQFLASRGYAVFQPNYRGSTGFGLKHLTSSFKQLGQSMQDDVTDGVRSLIASGKVDPDRICIGGGSYGGYATMMGLVREPDLFKCGIDVVGVTDLFWWIELGYTDFNRGDAKAAEAWLTRTIGDPDKDRPMMTANSPRFQAAKVKAPVLIVHGANDVRVPIRHGEAMRDALKAAGQQPEWLVFPDEGHGFRRAANRIAYYKAIEAFLARHLGR